MDQGRGRTYRAGGPPAPRPDWHEPRLGAWAHRWGTHPPPPMAQWSIAEEADGWEGGEWADHGVVEPRRPRLHGAGRGPKGYRRSDERLREDACDLLMAVGGVDVSEVEVSVEDGEITLEGTVPDRWSKRRVEDLCEAVLGVVDVHNRLRIVR